MKFLLGNNEGKPVGATVWSMALEVRPPLLPVDGQGTQRGL
jgi:hypothetical protein